MVDDPDTSAELGAPPDLHAAGNACERRHERVLANIHIMRDMAQIIELDPISQDRVTEHAPVDRAIRAHTHIIAQYHPAVMGQLHQPGRARCQPESGLAYHTARTDTAITPDNGKPDHRASRHARPVSDLDAGSNNGIRTDMTVRPDTGTFTDTSTGADNRIRRDDRRRVNGTARRVFAGRYNPAGDSRKGRFGMPYGNEGSLRVQHRILERASIADNDTSMRRESVRQLCSVGKNKCSG